MTTRANAGADALTWAETKKGDKYLWGGTGPEQYDCSGLTQAAYDSVGIKLPRTTFEQCRLYVLPRGSDNAPGDLLFFESTQDGPAHVGIYVSPGRMFEAPHTGALIDFASYEPTQVIVATRPSLALPAEPLPEEPVTNQETSAEQSTIAEELKVESATNAQIGQVNKDLASGKVRAAEAVLPLLKTHLSELTTLVTQLESEIK